MNKKVKGIVITITVLLVLALSAAIVFARYEAKKPQPVSGNVTMNYIDDQPVQGDLKAPASIIEFADFKCPGCRYFAKNIYPRIVKDFVETGKANFKFINLAFLGPDSLTAAEASEYVAKYSPEDFWVYYDKIYQGQKDESENWATFDYLISLAKEAGVNVNFTDMEKSLKNHEFGEEVNNDLNFSRSLGIRQTPTLVVNGLAIETGNLSYDQIKEAINTAIEREGK